MLLTNSMRRKLGINLALVVLMLLLFSVSSLLGIVSYRRMVSDLALSITNIPRRDELVATLTSLVKPLQAPIPGPTAPVSSQIDAAKAQYRHFGQVFSDVEKRVATFQQQCHNLPESLRPSYPEESSYNSMFLTVHNRLAQLRSEQDFVFDPRLRQEFHQDVIRCVAELTSIAEKLPDPSNRLGERLKEASEDYKFHFRMVMATGLISLALFSLLSYWTWKWIFAPIHRLTVGVDKISSGDYGFRLKVDTTCELSQMGQTFNKMAAKIEQDQRDKEREIAERSKQLVQSERLAGAGFLASGVAHEINNPLTVIMTAASGLERRLTDDVLESMSEKDRKRVHDYLQLIQSETERCERITKKLLDFSYGNGDERNLYDVVAVAQEVASMVGHLSKFQDRTVTVNRTEPLHAWVNGPEIKQVVLNLVANGLDACTSGGQVDISIEELVDDVQITIADNGCGMSPEQRQKIFEPFFTTKEIGKGTGLGLSITHRIVADHYGTLEVASDGPGQGSTFTLRLPKREARSNAA
ncbi:HAMP domain-containing sensor histidine kinase [Thalassoglobus sp. JC818]|uniref:sensor histidine kinase n=1 Tax=Thalassoglobus sp. JC818 TaxID=3232136 RepID=UPI003459B435